MRLRDIRPSVWGLALTLLLVLGVGIARVAPGAGTSAVREVAPVVSLTPSEAVSPTEEPTPTGSPTPSPSESPSPPGEASSAAPPSPSAVPSPSSAVASVTPVAPAPAATSAAAPAVPAALGSVPASARQAVLASAAGYGSTSGSLTTWTRGADGGWQRVLAPVTAYYGYNGLASAASKQEGDGRTPTGTYTLTSAFGVNAKPATGLPYAPVGTDDVWDDRPSSPTYNQRVDGGAPNGEALYNTPAYNEAVVVDYNTARVPGKGSAIFFHVSTGHPTAGCVSIAESQLLAVMAWLDPAQGPVIVISAG